MSKFDSTAPLFPRGLLAALWCILLVVFLALRWDTSERTYFQIDDLVVVWVVDDAINQGNWQPDWYRVGEQARKKHDDKPLTKTNSAHDIPHDHHYNFSAHMLLSAAIIKPLRLLGVNTPTIVLLHHIALAWDTVSLLFLVAAAWQLGGQRLALCSAIIYTVFPLAVQGSHYARPDALLTAMGSAVLWLGLQKNHIVRGHWLLANGLFIGIATGGKASQLMLGIFPATACISGLLNRTQWNGRTFFRIATDGISVLAVIAATLGLMFVIGDMQPIDFWLSMRSIQLYYQHPQPPDTLEFYSVGGQLIKIMHYFYATLGWPLILASLAGIVALAHRADKLPLLLLTLPLAFFIFYFATLPAFFDRSFCTLAAAIVLLSAIGISAAVDAISALPARQFFSVVITLLACWKPVVIQYHLQTDHLREHHNNERLLFQQQLKQDWSAKTGVNFWLKNIDTRDLFSQTLPEKPPQNPRIYVVEDMNDWNSRDYLKKLRANGFVQIAEFTGDFADMPTNSLITVHEAARFVYFIRADEHPPLKPLPQPDITK